MAGPEPLPAVTLQPVTEGTFKAVIGLKVAEDRLGAIVAVMGTIGALGAAARSTWVET